MMPYMKKYGVKRSLRDLNGIGINAGITNVSLSKSIYNR